LGVDFPSKVVSTGGRFQFKDDWQTPDTQNILYNFPNNTAAEWEGRSCNGYNMEGLGRGVIFYGDKGTISKVLNYKQPLSLTMIRKFSKLLRLPSDALTKEYQII